jgi:hypothetical protein
MFLPSRLSSLKSLALTVLCSVYFCTSALPQYAALAAPAGMPAIPSFNLPPIIPVAGDQSLSATSSALKKFGALPRNMTPLVNAIPLSHANIHDLFSPPKPNLDTAPVVLVQDIHLNPEAQFNIATVLQSFVDHELIGAIGIEGAFEDVDVTEFRRFEPKATVKQAMDVFVEHKLLSAPAYVGITSVKEPPLLLGLDDRQHYDANVAAYLESRRLAERVKKELAKAERELEEKKSSVFSPELKKFDSMVKAYHEGKVGLGEYAEFCMCMGHGNIFLPM